MQLTPQNMPSFQHFPGPLRSNCTDAVISDWALPAPALLKRHRHRLDSQQEYAARLYVGENQSGRMWVLLSRRQVAVKTPLAVSDPVHDRDGCFVRHAGARGAGKRWPRPYLQLQSLAVTMGVRLRCRPAARSGCVSAARPWWGLWSGAFVATSGTRHASAEGPCWQPCCCGRGLCRRLRAATTSPTSIHWPGKPKQGSHYRLRLGLRPGPLPSCGGASRPTRFARAHCQCGAAPNFHTWIARDGSASALSPGYRMGGNQRTLAALWRCFPHHRSAACLRLD